MEDISFLLFIVIVLLTYLIYKVRQTTLHLIILDARIRALEQLVVYIANSDMTTDKYKEIYNDIFEDFNDKTFNKIVKFGRKHDLQLPLETLEEERQGNKRFVKHDTSSLVSITEVLDELKKKSGLGDN
jgi:hypothetical protein